MRVLFIQNSTDHYRDIALDSPIGLSASSISRLGCVTSKDIISMLDADEGVSDDVAVVAPQQLGCAAVPQLTRHGAS